MTSAGRSAVFAVASLVILSAISFVFSGESAADPVRALAVVAKQGQVAPGTGGGTFTRFDEPFVNSVGDTTFGACYEGGLGDVGAGDGCGVFFMRGGVLSYVALTGQAVPAPGSGTFSFEFDGPILNNKGTVAFVARQITDSSTAPIPATALLQKTVAGSLTVLALRGDAVPGVVPTNYFLGFDEVSQNNLDDVAVIANFSAAVPPAGGPGTGAGVFLKPSGSAIAKIVAEGDALPAGSTACPSGLVTGGFRGDIDGPWLNDLKAVAFKIDGPCGNDSSGNDHVLFKPFGGSIVKFVAEGDPAPGFLGGGSLGGIGMGRPALNNSNTMVFGTTGGDGIGAIVTKKLGQTPVLCVKDLTPAPGTIGTFDGLAGNPAINQNGRVFVQADMTGDPTVSAGIVTCQNGVVRDIALEGDPIPGGTGTFTNAIEEGSIADSGGVVFLNEEGPDQGVYMLALKVGVTGSGPFRDVRRDADINFGPDLGGTHHESVNFTGSTGSAGDTWITVYDTSPWDPVSQDIFGSVSLTADVLIHPFNNGKGAGLLALYNEAVGKKGLALIVSDAGNTDRLILSTVNQAGQLVTLQTVALGSGIKEDVWYRLTMDVVVSGGNVTVTGKVFTHSSTTDPDSSLGAQTGPTLVFSGLLPTGVDPTGEIGIIASAVSAVVDSSVTNFNIVP